LSSLTSFQLTEKQQAKQTYWIWFSPIAYAVLLREKKGGIWANSIQALINLLKAKGKQGNLDLSNYFQGRIFVG